MMRSVRETLSAVFPEGGPHSWVMNRISLLNTSVTPLGGDFFAFNTAQRVSDRVGKLHTILYPTHQAKTIAVGIGNLAPG
jgi:hypothetical protein